MHSEKPQTVSLFLLLESLSICVNRASPFLKELPGSTALFRILYIKYEFTLKQWSTAWSSDLGSRALPSKIAKICGGLHLSPSNRTKGCDLLPDFINELRYPDKLVPTWKNGEKHTHLGIIWFNNKTRWKWNKKSKNAQRHKMAHSLL